MEKNLLYFVSLLFSFYLFTPQYSCSQTSPASPVGLYISEIHFVKNNPSMNWVEVSNPTDESLTLVFFRISSLLTPNILKHVYDNGIAVGPGDSIILCAKGVFEKNLIQDKSKIFLLDALNCSDNGGYLSLVSKTGLKVFADNIRFGDPKESAHVKNLLYLNPVPFCADGDFMSYMRKAVSVNGIINLTEFEDAISTPGRFDKQ